MQLNDINSFGRATTIFFLNVADGGAPPAAAVFAKNLTKIYCEVNKSNGVKSRVTLDKTTSLQVFSQNYTLLHANYLKYLLKYCNEVLLLCYMPTLTTV